MCAKIENAITKGNCVTAAQQTLTLYVGVRIPIPLPKKTDHIFVVCFSFFGQWNRGFESQRRRRGIRIRHSKIDKLACQAKSARILVIRRASLFRDRIFVVCLSFLLQQNKVLDQVPAVIWR